MITRKIAAALLLATGFLTAAMPLIAEQAAASTAPAQINAAQTPQVPLTTTPAPVSIVQTPPTLTIQQAVDLIYQNNLSFKTAELEATIKKREKDFVFNGLYPTVSASGTTSKLNTAPLPALVATTPSPNGTYYAADSRNLSLNLKIQELFSPVLFAQFQKVDVEYQNALITRDQSQRALIASVKEFFYQLLVQKKAIELTQTRLKNSQERMRQSEISSQLGQQSELTYIQNQVDVLGLIPQLQELTTTYANNLITFQELLGLQPREDLELVGSLEEDAPAIPPTDQLAPSRLDVKAQQGQVNSLENSISWQDLTLFPVLTLQYSADPDLNGPQNHAIFDSSNWFQTNGALSLTLSVNLEGLIPGSSFWINRAELSDRLALARQNTDQTRKNGYDDLNNRRRSIQTSLEKIENLKKAEAANKRALELTNAGYQLGTGRLLDLQAAELNYESAQISLLDERLNLKTLILDLEAQLDVDLGR